MKKVTLDQRTPEWLRWRQSGIGGSDAPAVVGLSPWRTPRELWDEKVNPRPARRENSAMARGRTLEPVIQLLYEQVVGFKIEPVCCEHDSHAFLKGSTDGWNEQRRLVVEMKAPNRDDHRLALAGRIPEKYVPQCDHLLLVTGGFLLHYVSFSDYFPPHQRLAIVPRYPNPMLLHSLLEAEAEFWELVTARVPPDEGEE